MTRVLVVGAGVIGLSSAWALTRAGAAVTVVDPDPERGASPIAAGMLAPIAEAHPTEPALLAAGRRAVEAWPDFASALAATGVDPGYRTTGTLVVGYTASDLAALDDLAARLAGLGVDVERLTGTACRRAEPALAPGVRGGLDVPTDHSVDNRALLRALRTALGAAGVEMIAEAPAEADVTVIAAGAWTPELEPSLDGLVRPVRGEIVRLRAGRRTPVLSRTVRALVDGRGVYLVPRATGELVVGATQDEVGFDRTVTAGGVHRLLTDARRVLPAVDEYALVETSAGLRPVSADGAPIVGAVGPGRVVATGHGRNGILFAPLTATLVADLVTGTAPDPLVAAAFAPGRFTPARIR
ncbi:glycine oxidase ThiO [Cryptosporangium phraense]|uniref:glycine oxidase n=1 Tax=Cryptosporangium phraense TaxID=2593070 RepID=A0A545AQM5_9ACTN|nr:glycine oxidase ThiO [Cryptosporangium phraense]TQS43630.1 glycine oxidase ThiO [Cryptosporangium phraense]